MAGSGALNQEMPMNAMYAGANLVSQYAIPSFTKGREISKNIVKEGAIKDLYAKSTQAGIQPKEEDLLNIYASVGDEDGITRMQERIDKRESTYQTAQDQMFLLQAENAIKNGQYDLVPKIIDARNNDSRLVNKTGKYSFDQNLGTFDRPLQSGETVALPDGTKVTGDSIGGINIKLGKDKSGKYGVLGIDTKGRDEILKAKATAQAKVDSNVGKIPAPIAAQLVQLNNLDRNKQDYFDAIDALPDDVLGLKFDQLVKMKTRSPEVANFLAKYEVLGRQIANMSGEGKVLSDQDRQMYERVRGEIIAGKDNLKQAYSSATQQAYNTRDSIWKMYDVSPLVDKSKEYVSGNAKPATTGKIKSITVIK